MQLSLEDRRTQWDAWFESAYQDIVSLMYNRLIWRNLIAMLQANPNIQHHSTINGYLTRSYAQTQAVGIRRQWDHTERRPTLGRVLEELSLYPRGISREHWTEALADPRGRTGWLTFSPNDDDHLDAAVAAADLERMANQTKPARDWTNHAVTHADRNGKHGYESGGDWFGDINSGLDSLARVVKKYWGLFHPGEHLAFVTPYPDLTFVRMFETAWFSDGFRPVLPGDLEPGSQ